MNSGVPQGWILSPILFILYSNNLPKNIKKVNKIMYADDILLHFTEVNIQSYEIVCFQDLNLGVQIVQELQCQ